MHIKVKQRYFKHEPLSIGRTCRLVVLLFEANWVFRHFLFHSSQETWPTKFPSHLSSLNDVLFLVDRYKMGAHRIKYVTFMSLLTSFVHSYKFMVMSKSSLKVMMIEWALIISYYSNAFITQHFYQQWATHLYMSWCTLTTACLYLGRRSPSFYGGRNIWQSFKW